MIGRLRGHLIQDAPDGGVLLDVNGVGYELLVPLGTIGRAGADEEGLVTLLVHTHVREGAIELFGFASHDERTTFRTLLGISKVGPKLAVAVLSSITVDELVQVVESGHSSRLTKVPGVGKKTAERIVLELKGKLSPGAALSNAVVQAQAQAQRAAPSGKRATLQQTLVQLGFKPSDAERAVGALADLDRPMDALVREALGVLAP